MLVVIANDLPPAVRGRMKLWFIEPRPHVFVSGIKDHVAKNVVEFLLDHCPTDSGAMIFWSKRNTPGFDIITIGDTTKKQVEVSGLKLILEKENGPA
jgi:CRISPR-associated protein Cas2